jgi:hypothetical protein
VDIVPRGRGAETGGINDKGTVVMRPNSRRSKHAVYRLRLPNLEDGDSERLSSAESALIDLIRKRQGLGDTIVLDVTPSNA